MSLIRDLLSFAVAVKGHRQSQPPEARTRYIAKMKQYSERDKKESTQQQRKDGGRRNGRYFSWRKRLGLSSDFIHKSHSRPQ
jgi:hypothetical protein